MLAPLWKIIKANSGDGRSSESLYLSEAQTEASADLPAVSTVKAQLSLPCLLEATNIISPASTLLTLKSFSVCWSSSGIDISQTPGLPASSAPLLRNGANRHIHSVLGGKKHQILDSQSSPIRGGCVILKQFNFPPEVSGRSLSWSRLGLS